MIALTNIREVADAKEQHEMSIDLEKEQLITLTEATRFLRRAHHRRVSISTLWRWCRRGVNGVHLEYLRLGRNIATSTPALGRFFQNLASADKPVARRLVDRPLPQPTPADRLRSIEDAERRLSEAGI